MKGAWPRLLRKAVKNDIQFPVAEALATAFHDPPQELVKSLERYRAGLDRFWSTVALTRDLLRDEGLDPVFIKTLRLQAYYDSNLDILVPQDQWPLVDGALARRDSVGRRGGPIWASSSWSRTRGGTTRPPA
jgi:hypothetical protein